MSSSVKDALFWPLAAWFFATVALGVGSLAFLYFQRRKRLRERKASFGDFNGLGWGGGGGNGNANGSWGMWVDENSKMPGDDAIRLGLAGAGGIRSASAPRGGESFQVVPDRGLESWQINAKELKIGPRIGAGNVGEVHRALYKGRPVAVKKLLASWLADQEMLERFREEAYLMSTLSHPNVLAFRGAVLDKETGSLSIVTDYCERGSLTEVLRSRQPLSWQRRLQMARDVALGMSYLHLRAGVIQRDLKSSNLLVCRDFTVVISDFGLSRLNSPGKMQTYCGTPAYLAPEVVRQEPYSQAADVYSFSIILWELLTREEPYPGCSGLALAYAVATQGLRPPIPAYCPIEWAALMTKCWADEPEKRPSFDEIQRALAGMIRIFDDHLKAKGAGPSPSLNSNAANANSSSSVAGSGGGSNNGSSGQVHKTSSLSLPGSTLTHLDDASALGLTTIDGRSSLPSLADIVTGGVAAGPEAVAVAVAVVVGGGSGVPATPTSPQTANPVAASASASSTGLALGAGGDGSIGRAAGMSNNKRGSLEIK